MHHTLGKVGRAVFYFYSLLLGHLYLLTILSIVLVLCGGKSGFLDPAARILQRASRDTADI